ncbi:hypothetical protein [Motilibacter aurantiacus]|uniref:hypothetical protein n=1 Tax=Motilibacter aurantiacus TaxID=2714955 RepID=UPI001407AB57|nr:hypothetical protein [Motilibacter aurantiacus]NHC47483.1 hypothetical protein [Motilibacter aurantiacus]
MTSPASRRPTGYDIVLPPAWWHVPLGSGRHASVAALIRHQVRRSPKEAAALLRGGLRRELAGIVERAAHSGASDLYLSLGVEQGIPLAASLVVQRLPGATGITGNSLELVERVIVQSGGTTRPLRVGRGRGLGVAGRRVEMHVLPESVLDGGRAPLDASTLPQSCTTHLDVFIPVPQSADLLLLAFSTPVPALADAFVDLFEAMAQSLTWTYGRAGRRTPGTSPPRVTPRVPTSRCAQATESGVESPGRG